MTAMRVGVTLALTKDFHRHHRCRRHALVGIDRRALGMGITMIMVMNGRSRHRDGVYDLDQGHDQEHAHLQQRITQMTVIMMNRRGEDRAVTMMMTTSGGHRKRSRYRAHRLGHHQALVAGREL
jgi:hypothetical protein